MRGLCLVVAALAACASNTAAAPSTAPAGAQTALPDPEPVPADLEARIAAAERTLVDAPVRSRFHVRSSGAFDSRFVGSLVMEGERVRISAAGRFGGRPVEVSLVADGARMRGEGGARSFDLPQPPHLREVLGVSIVRMGLLHTLAMLVAGRPPDVPEDDARTWLVLTPQPGAPTVAVMEPHHANLPTDPITFRTSVAGDESISATVWIEEAVLLERQQTTRFDEETMEVLEAFEPL